MSKPNLLLIVSGSIAAFKAAALASRLVQEEVNVQVVLSRGGARFVGAATFEGITGRPVLDDLWAAGHAMDHIESVDWADLMVVYPASANTITRLSAGLADDLVGCLFLANNFRKQWWIAPAMNRDMLAHPAVTDALARLDSWGCRILETNRGRMACGTVGEGRLMEPEEAAALIGEAVK